MIFMTCAAFWELESTWPLTFFTAFFSRFSAKKVIPCEILCLDKMLKFVENTNLEGGNILLQSLLFFGSTNVPIENHTFPAQPAVSLFNYRVKRICLNWQGLLSLCRWRHRQDFKVVGANSQTPFQCLCQSPRIHSSVRSFRKNSEKCLRLWSNTNCFAKSTLTSNHIGACRTQNKFITPTRWRKPQSNWVRNPSSHSPVPSGIQAWNMQTPQW